MNYTLNLAPSECSVVANKPIGVQRYTNGFQRPLRCCTVCRTYSATDRKHSHTIIHPRQIFWLP